MAGHHVSTFKLSRLTLLYSSFVISNSIYGISHPQLFKASTFSGAVNSFFLSEIVLQSFIVAHLGQAITFGEYLQCGQLGAPFQGAPQFGQTLPCRRFFTLRIVSSNAIVSHPFTLILMVARFLVFVNSRMGFPNFVDIATQGSPRMEWRLFALLSAKRRG